MQLSSITSFENKKMFSLFFLFYLISLLIYNIPSLFLIMNILFYFMFIIFMLNKGLRNPYIITFSLFIISIPLSYISFLGIPYSALPISWFNIFGAFLILFLFINAVIKGEFKLNIISIISIFILIYSIILVLISLSISEGLKQVINNLFFFLLIILWGNKKFTINYANFLKKIYVYTILSLSVVVIIQALLFRLGVPIGNTILYGGNRYATGYLFGDFSFLSLYLVTAIFLIYMDKENFGGIQKKSIFILLICLSSYLTTARTGLFALISVVMIYFSIYSVKNILKKTPQVIFSWLCLLLSLLIFIGLISIIRNEGLFSDSGRFEGYMIALREWVKKPIFGLGFDLQNYTTSTGEVIPHNIFIQSLLQGGIIYLLLISIFILSVFLHVYFNEKNSIWTLLVIIIGAQFIPDIFDSRYLLVVILMLTIKIKDYFINQNQDKYN